jgi:hypothetical protein
MLPFATQSRSVAVQAVVTADDADGTRHVRRPVASAALTVHVPVDRDARPRWIAPHRARETPSANYTSLISVMSCWSEPLASPNSIEQRGW